MTKKLTAIFILLLLQSAFIFAENVKEFRAVKITNVDSDVLFSDANIAEAMDYLASIGVNVILPVGWNGSGADGSYTIYPSAAMDSIFGQPMHPGFDQHRDPLGRVIVEAHRNGMEVLPWFEMGFSCSYSQNGGYILQQFPDWSLKNSSGNLVVKNGFDWMSAVNPEVQNFITALVVEVVQNYDIDGIEFSDRIPAMPVEGGYDSTTVAIYKQEHAGQPPPTNYRNPNWMEWRADKLSDFFQSVRDTVKSYGEHHIVSSSPSIYPWGYEEYLQDSEEWVSRGIIDNLIPQLYRYSFSEYQYELNHALDLLPTSWQDQFFAGMLIKVGSYTISPEFLLQSIDANRSNNVDGEALFFYEGLRDDNNLLGDTLGATVYAEPATNPYRTSDYWRPRGIIVSEDDPTTHTTGDWTASSISGYDAGIYITTAGEPATIHYNFNVPATGWYTMYTYQVTGGSLTNQAHYTLYSASDSTDTFVNQRNSYNAGWRSLGDVYLEAGNHEVLKLDNSYVTGSDKLVADAAMLLINRQKSPAVVISDIHKHDYGTLPTRLSLHQNFPNPFNGDTQIVYELSKPGLVQITVHNLLGQVMKTFQRRISTGGVHTIQLNADDWSSGIYFYTVEFSPSAGSGITQRQSGKMLLLK